MNNDPESLLRSLGAREFQIVALMADPTRAMAAIAEAQRRGVEHPVPYALTLFDDPSWTPKESRVPRLTNLAVDRNCVHCGGDRFVEVTNDPSVLYGESYAPCVYCNADANTSFYRPDGTRAETKPR